MGILAARIAPPRSLWWTGVDLAASNMAPSSGFASQLASKFHKWHRTGSRGTFVHYLAAELSGADRMRLQKGRLRESFIEAGIDPDVHLRSRLDKGRVKARLRQIISETADIVGAEGLHDNGMHSTDRIPLPLSLRCPGTFPLSSQYGEEPVITKQALQRKLVAATGKAWAEILDQTGFSSSNRRIASRSFSQTVQLFADLPRRPKRRWTKASLREKQPVVYKAAWNLKHRMDSAGVPAALRRAMREDPIFTLSSVAAVFVEVGNLERAVKVFLKKKPAFAARFYHVPGGH
jgi:hypothetical protein